MLCRLIVLDKNVDILYERDQNNIIFSRIVICAYLYRRTYVRSHAGNHARSRTHVRTFALCTYTRWHAHTRVRTYAHCRPRYAITYTDIMIITHNAISAQISSSAKGTIYVFATLSFAPSRGDACRCLSCNNYRGTGVEYLQQRIGAGVVYRKP